MIYSIKIKMNKTLVIHPFLFAIFPIIFLFSVNVNSVSPEEIIFPLFSVIAVTFLIWIVLGFLLKNRIKSGFIVSIGLVLFFSYGHIYILLDDFQKDSNFSHFILIIPVLLLFVLGSYYFIKTKKSLNNPTKIVNVVSVSLVFISLLGIGEYFITESFSQNEIDLEPKKQQVHASETKKLHDVYYIILDGYSGSKSLETILNYDNSEFTDFLINKGFYISTESYSNYKRTTFSIPSTLSMNYLNYLAEIKGIDSTDENELVEISRNSEVIKNFKSEGYTTYAIEAGSKETNKIKNIDFRLCTKKNVSESEFGSMLIRTTILNPVQVKLFSNEKRDKILCGFSELIKMADRNESPKFVLAHLMIPHRPYIFGPTGELVYAKLLTLDDLDENWNSELYLGQLEFSNLRMKEVISKLTDRNDPPIIIIQSDHGMRGGDFNNEYELMLKNFNNFKAYYFPEVGRNIEFETTTPVNSFRVLFNLYFDDDYEILEDKIYGNTKEKPYQFRDVTDVLIKK